MNTFRLPTHSARHRVQSASSASSSAAETSGVPARSGSRCAWSFATCFILFCGGRNRGRRRRSTGAPWTRPLRSAERAQRPSVRDVSSPALPVVVSIFFGVHARGDAPPAETALISAASVLLPSTNASVSSASAFISCSGTAPRVFWLATKNVALPDRDNC